MSRSGTIYKPSVVHRMESSLRLYVVPRIGGAPAALVARRDVQRLVDELAAETNPETARKALHALAAVFRLAERNGLVDRSPVDRIRVPQSDTGEREVRVITPEEADLILRAAAADDAALARSMSFPLFTLAFRTGLRSGELLALRWGPHGPEDEGVDLASRKVRVRWSQARVRDPRSGAFPLVRPKTRAARRDIPLGSAVESVMRAHYLASGRPRIGSFVFTGPSGACLNPHSIPRHAWKRVTEAAGVVEPRPRFHDARHAWAVMMLRAGVSAQAIAKLGGWADVGIIHRRYGRHALPDELEGAGDELAAWLEFRRSRGCPEIVLP